MVGARGFEPPALSLLVPNQARYQATVYTPTETYSVRYQTELRSDDLFRQVLKLLCSCRNKKGASHRHANSEEEGSGEVVGGRGSLEGS